MECKVGQFALRTTVGQQSVSGLTEPSGGWKVLVVWTAGTTANDVYVVERRFGFGFATSATQRYGCGLRDNDSVGTSNNDTGSTTSGILRYGNGSNVNALMVDFVSFNSDGFTIDVEANTEARANLINYMLLGGTDITNAKVGTFTVASTGASQAFTDPGFQPDFLMAAHIDSTSVGDSVHAKFGLGMASSPSNTGAHFGLSLDNQADASAGSWRKSGAVLLGLTSNGSYTQDYEANLSSFDSQGFTLSVSNLPSVNKIFGYLAIKGGQWKVGAETQRTSAGTKDTAGIGFDPKCIFVMADQWNAETVLTSGDQSNIGAATSTEQAGISSFSNGNTGGGNTETDTFASSSITEALLISNGTSAAAEAGIAPITDGFRATWAPADAFARIFYYAAMADGPSTFVPQITMI